MGQIQAQEQYLGQALAAGNTSPQRYQQLMAQMQQRRDALQKYMQGQAMGQSPAGPGLATALRTRIPDPPMRVIENRNRNAKQGSTSPELQF
jgi:hypothetical protein